MTRMGIKEGSVMNCDKIREMLSLYIDQMLDDDLKKEIEEHISTCNLCKNEYDDIKEMVSLLKEVEMVSVPESFEHRLKNALQHEKTKISDAKIIEVSANKKKKLRIFTSIAAIFAVGLLSFGFYQDVIGGLTDQLDGTAQLAQERKIKDQVNQEQAIQGQVDQDQANQDQFMKNQVESGVINNKVFESNLDESNIDKSNINEEEKYKIRSGSGAADNLLPSEASEQRMRIYGQNDNIDNYESDNTMALVPEDYVDEPSGYEDSDGNAPEYSSMMTSKEFSRALTTQAIERNVAAVQYYKGLIEDKLRDFKYEILESDFVQAGECRFRIYIFSRKDGYVFNEEISATGKDGEIEFIYTNEFMGL